MNKPVGGRGKKAPYETTHVRIPVDIKDRVEKLKEQFILGHLDFVDELTAENNRLASEYRKLLTGNEQNLNPSQYPLTPLEDDDDEVEDLLVDDSTEPSDSEVIKFQAEKIQTLMTDVRLLERELEELKSKNNLLTGLEDRITVLQIENEQVQQQLKKIRLSEQDLLDQVCKCHSDSFKAADILKAALKLRSNAGGAIKREIEKVLPLIDDV